MSAKFAWILLVLLSTAVSCATIADPTATPLRPTAPPPTATALVEPTSGTANVESLQVLVLESFPVKVQAQIRGVLPDGCTTLDKITTEQAGTSFSINLTTLRDNTAVCTQAEVPFDETIPLDVAGLDAGQYTVSANGINGSFTLAVDNRIPVEVQATPAPTAEPADAAINGRVWHDLCATTGGEEAPPPGCVPGVDGGFQANGVLEPGEPGIEAVLVHLGEGECPSVGLDEQLTDGSGRYAFTGLPAGNYCVSVDALAAPNDVVLLPGGWRAPNENGRSAVSLGAGETIEALNFGWDYQFLPIPEIDQSACIRSFEFVEDVTVPDDTTFNPGENFIKTWRLKNSGTCPWIDGYSIVFVGGDQLGGPDTQTLTAVIAPGQSGDVSVNLTAPEGTGTYRGNWQLADADGSLFGVGGLLEEAIFVQIAVSEAQPAPEPGTALLGGLVWADFCSFNDDGTTAGACLETAEGSGIFTADGVYQASEERLADIEVTLSQGACPTEGGIEENSVLARSTTDADGLYQFPGMDAGTYCLSINAFSEQNVNQLIPGDWTWPARGVPWFTAVLDAGEQFVDIDFGWDYQLD